MPVLPKEHSRLLFHGADHGFDGLPLEIQIAKHPLGKSPSG
jgi:hypothetical protein